MKYFETKKDSLEEAISKAINEKKLDAVGKEDGDIDNDGDKDASDKYLAKRRKAISKAIKKDQKEESDMVERKVTATVNDLTDRKFQKAQLMKDLRADAKKMSRDAFVKKNSYRVKPDALAVMWNALNEELEEKTTKDVDETLDKIREANVAKQKSMREILADIWNMNEGKNPFEKKEGFASDAQRKAAFASGYKEKGKKKKEEVEKSSKTATGQKPTKVEIEPEVK